MGAVRRRLARLRQDTGSLAWVIILTVLLLMLTTAMINSTVVGVQRSAAQTNGVLLTQRVETATSAAISRLNSTGFLPTHDTAVTDCQTVDGRPICYKYWGNAVPGHAVDPVRYDLLVHTWIDNARTGVEPATGVRAQLISLEAITYQTSAGQQPQVSNGYVSYAATPLGLFSHAIHAFNAAVINGPTTTISSYNSESGVSGTGNAVVSADGTLEYGTDIKVDRSELYGGASPAGNFTERCTGEPCAESDVHVAVDTHQAPTPASVAWMYSAPCTVTVNGDWLASANGGKLPQGTLCVKGDLIIDTATTRSVKTATVYVYGNIVIKQNLNAPASGLALPGQVAIYSTGTAVTFDPQTAAAPGTGIAALLYAPLATCANSPSGNNPVTYYGSLVCGTVSIAGPWTHQYDEAGSMNLTDPVAGAAAVWSAGPPQNVDAGAYLQPSDWNLATCVVPAPTNAFLAYKMDEKTGAVAHDSSGNGKDGGWLTANRPDGFCGTAAPMTTGGAVTYPTTVAGSTINGGTIEFWAQGVTGTVFSGAGLTVAQTANGHTVVTSGGVSTTFPFTTQNYGSWHAYVVVVAPNGAAQLYVDGALKESVSTAAIAYAGSAVTVANGTAGNVDELAYYARQLSASEVASRWTMWNTEVAFTATFAGDPFTAPGAITDNGSATSLLKVAWTASAGTLPSPAATYVVQRASTAIGPFSDIGSVPMGTLSFTQTGAPNGAYYYRACASYNGDAKCGAATSVVTLPIPTAPTISFGTATSSTTTTTWTTPAYTASFQFQYTVNGSAWSGGTTAADGQPVTTTAGTSMPLGPTGGGYTLQARVRAVNAAGIGPWSNVASQQLLTSAPTLSISNVTNTNATVSWAALYGAASYKGQYRINGGAWVPQNLGTSTSVGLYTGNIGDRIDYQAAGVLSDGRVGDWSAIATVNLTIPTPAANYYGLAQDSYPNLYGVIGYNSGPMCPNGTVVQMQYRDQATSWGTTWNGWTGWYTGTAGAWSAPWALSVIGSYDVGANQQYYIRCYNPNSGNVGASWGPHGPNALWHAIPNPWGVWAGITSWRTAGWGASCASGSTASYQWQVVGAFNTGVQGWTFSTGWANTGQAWGSGTLWVTARCEASGRYSGTVSTSAGF